MSEPNGAGEGVAVALAELRGTMAEGFATVNGSLSLLNQRGEQTDEKLKDHEQRLDALEKSRWPLPSLVALVGLISLALTLWQTTKQ